MNIISYDAAHSLYPRATFEERRTLAMSVSTPGEIEALGKYAVRGWKIQEDIWAHEENKPRTSSFHMFQIRWVNDNKTWTIPLDVTGVIMRPPPSATSDAFTWDPVVQNSWKLARRVGGLRLVMTYFTAKSTVFRYNYLIADKKLMGRLMTFFRAQGSLEHDKRQHLSEEDKRNSVTWCAQ
jgi:hypothetical protein